MAVGMMEMGGEPVSTTHNQTDIKREMYSELAVLDGEATRRAVVILKEGTMAGQQQPSRLAPVLNLLVPHDYSGLHNQAEPKLYISLVSFIPPPRPQRRLSPAWPLGSENIHIQRTGSVKWTLQDVRFISRILRWLAAEPTAPRHPDQEGLRRSISGFILSPSSRQPAPKNLPTSSLHFFATFLLDLRIPAARSLQLL